MLLEICANSYQSAMNAQEAGAHRVELCVDLDVGGLTPSYGLIKKVIQDLLIPVFILIRPRKGNFTYSDDEFEMMKTNVQMAKDLGCDGIVSGILTSNYAVDTKRTKMLINLSHPLPFTFHRAFDLITEPKKAIMQLIDLGVDRLLSSGQEYYAETGLPLLSELKGLTNEEIIIMPGGGINQTNANLFKKAEYNEIHAAALCLKGHCVNEEGKLFENNEMRYSDVNLIKAILKIINSEK